MNNLRALTVTLMTIVTLAGVVFLPVVSASASEAKVSSREHRAASGALERVERDMRADGAHRSTLHGCWVAGNAVDCTGVVHGRDADIKWRCIVLVTVRKGRGRLTDAVCTAEEAGGRRHAGAR